MHMVIRAIVHALTDKAALSEAQEVFEELFEMEDDDFYSFSIKKYGGGLRYNAYNIERYRGHPIWLYDSDGEGIHTPGHLKRALKDKDVWVVPADVHF